MYHDVKSETIYYLSYFCVCKMVRSERRKNKIKLTKNAEHTFVMYSRSSCTRRQIVNRFVHAERYFRCHPLAEKAKCEVVNGQPCTGADGRGFSVLFPFFRCHPFLVMRFGDYNRVFELRRLFIFNPSPRGNGTSIKRKKNQAKVDIECLLIGR